MKNTRCGACGCRRRHDARGDFCPKCRDEHGPKFLVCKICGKEVGRLQIGWHVSTKCETRGAWNKGLGLEDPRVERIAARTRGIPKGEEFGRKISEAMLRPEVRKKLSETSSISQRKRFSRPEEREASRKRAMVLIEEGKIVPYGGRGHGNGKPPTDSEVEMGSRLLKLGFIQELVVPTGTSKSPTFYRIDFAHQEMMLAVEIDGGSHQGPTRRASDERKDSFLKSKGWRVLRFRVVREGRYDYDEIERRCVEVLSSMREMSGT